MDMSALDAALNAMSLGPQVGAAMLSKALDTTEALQMNMINAIELSAPPVGIGDVGGLLDAYA